MLVTGFFSAIIFPKHGEEPINGAAITDEQKAKANVQVNVDAILGDDVHGALKLRRQKAKKKLINREKLEKAMEERRRCKKEDG